jgi:esterase/lipase superfamily enzyme
VTLYASSRDWALWASRNYHGGYRRAGDSDGEVVIVPGVDTIDASAVETSLGVGHFYYAENRSVLSDMFYVLREGKPPDQRFGLMPMTRGGDKYWIFRP